MSIPASGSFTRSAGLISAIGKQLKTINLKPLKKITVQFDPFYNNIKDTRQFLFYLSTPKILGTNLYCALKTNIVCDRSEPTITFDLVSGDKIVIKSANLSTLELLQQYNKHITPLVPKEEEAKEKVAQLTGKGKKGAKR
ncbi:39S ribosomal protein L53, mitochondrial [Cephus cinctus]|uniref:Large ribosomal subunit protein mL53 n=1 Tax=Cephus cinctus TaxID=211228 RepID=A0AAJ7BIZ0_CEPCN|nr:39S ribosomal protein L53, mitochondrial [Cephus cinctus]